MGNEKFVEGFCKKLDAADCSYTRGQTKSGKPCLTLTVSERNYTNLQFTVFFDAENSAQIRCFQVCKFSKERNLAVLKVVNQLNVEYRWVKFAASTDGEVEAEIDCITAEASCVDALFSCLYRIIYIVNEAYPLIMKAIYN